MPGAVRHKVAHHRVPDQCEVADRIQNLVADELVVEPQRVVQHAGLAEHDRVVERAAQREAALTQGDKRIALYPSDHFKVTYSIAFDHPLLRHQSRTIRLTAESFVDEIAPARTFTFLKEVEMLRQRGLALGGSLENAVVIGDTGILNNALRFDDEFVRHKILDVVGDMALVGHPIIGHLVAHRGGHALHTAFAAQVLEERDAWTLVESPVEPTDDAASPVQVPGIARAN